MGPVGLWVYLRHDQLKMGQRKNMLSPGRVQYGGGMARVEILMVFRSWLCPSAERGLYRSDKLLDPESVVRE